MIKFSPSQVLKFTSFLSLGLRDQPGHVVYPNQLIAYLLILVRQGGFRLRNGHLRQICEARKLLARIWRGKSHFFQKWHLANVGESGEFVQHGLANDGKSGKYLPRRLANLAVVGCFILKRIKRSSLHSLNLPNSRNTRLSRVCATRLGKNIIQDLVEPITLSK